MTVNRMAGESPISLSAFASRAEALNIPKKFAIAVSGGRDSIALARLCAEYAGKTGAQVLAFTVDHGLRPEAGDEARQVAEWCAGFGIPHQVLRWEGGKPETGIQAAARSARYRLLIEAAQNSGCDALLTAHTRDDQAETVLMRLARGAGVRGLSAMHAETQIASGAGVPIRLLRPMLGFGRMDITQFLVAAGQDFVDDPSNDDHAYERVRVRALIGALEEQHLLSATALAATAAKMWDAEKRLREAEDTLFNSLAGQFHHWGGVSLGRVPSGRAGVVINDTLVGLARRLIFAVGGGDHPPNEAQTEAAIGQARSSSASTLGGALLKMRKDRLWFLREPAALLGRAGVAPLARVPLLGPLVWDNRFICAPDGPSVEIGPLGEEGEATLGVARSLFDGPPEALFTLPGVYAEGVLIDAPVRLFKGSDAAAFRSLTPERYASEIVRFS
ncbi:tRNA lysidine(34) synthetase TilS [Hyphococcus lacteus]|uniref:tRNA(Ile)-lysidine synthase n=1 Tax=Hyphococcus lacteus TaxID=3143536 RepID=A0ABV3Z0V6_9PROT